VLTRGTRVVVPEPGAGAGEVLFSYLDTGRWRSLVRYTTLSGVRVVRLHWSDELEPVGARVVELDVTGAPGVELIPPQPDGDRGATRRNGPRRPRAL